MSVSAMSSVPARTSLERGLLVLAVGFFALGGLFVLALVPFPTAYDELQHVSFIRALREAPALYPAYGTYRVLSEDLSRWTTDINYLAHPPLYYLLLAPLGDHVVLLRAVNVLMATAGFALCAHAGLLLLPTTAQRCAFLALLLVFSKPALVAGMVNNDNLVLFETGLLFWLLATDAMRRMQQHRSRPSLPWKGRVDREAIREGSGRRDGPLPSPLQREGATLDPELDSRLRGNNSADAWRTYMIALVLAATGWTKLNAFVGLALWVGLLHLDDLLRSRRSLFGRTSTILLTGVLIGAAPALHNLARIGTVAYVPRDFLYVVAPLRPVYDFTGFTSAFFDKIGVKILYMDGVVNLLPLVVAMALFGAFVPSARNVSSRSRAIAVTAWLATLGFAALHLHYGWTSFITLGSLSDAQSRYYVMLWPGFALAAVVGGSAIVWRFTSPRLRGEVAARVAGGG